jgi:S-adenosylmethionine decarboxylase
MNAGTEWLVDADGCPADLLRNIDTVRRLCDEIIEALELRVVDEPMWHQFPQPGGVTGLYLLTESHLACHTFPETGLVTFNLYCCRPRPRFAWEARLRVVLGAAVVTVRTAERGASTESCHDSLEAIHSSFEAKAPELTSANEVSGL